MPKNIDKLIALTREFSTKEFNDLTIFIQANKSKHESVLVNISNLLKNFKGEEPDAELKKIQKKHKLSDAVAKKIVGLSLQLTENYLFKEHCLKKEKEKALFLLNLSRKIDSDSLYAYYLKRIDKLLNTENINTKFGLLHQYSRESIQLNYLSLKDQRSGDINIQTKSNTLDRFYIVEKLKLLINARTRNTSVTIDYNILFEEEILDKIKSIDLSKDLAIRFYYLQWNLVNLIAPKENYAQLLEILRNQRNELSKNQISEVIIVMINSLSQFFKGQSYYESLMELYQLRIETNSILNSTGTISSFTYKNVITVALNLGNIKWANDFLAKYAKYLPKEDKNNVYYYNKVTILFADKKFEEALDFLNKCFPKDVLITLSVKRLYLKIFYELRNFDLVDSNTSSFKMYLRRLKSSSKNHLKYNKLFLEYFNQVFKIRIDPNATRKMVETLINKINDERIIPEKKWLSNKTKQLLANLK